VKQQEKQSIIIPSEDDVIGVFLTWLNDKLDADFYVKVRPDKIKGGSRKKDIDCIAEDRNTGRQIAIEESSFWKSEIAGKEAADWTLSINHIKKLLSGRVRGCFNITTPISFFILKQYLNDFSELLLDKLDYLVDNLLKCKIEIDGKIWYNLRNSNLQSLDSELFFEEIELPDKRFIFNVQGIYLKVNYENIFKSTIDFLRPRKWDDTEKTLLSQTMNRIIKAKDAKLEPYKNRGLETWIVIYSTMWTTISFKETQAILYKTCKIKLNYADHLVLVSGNPPDNANSRVEEVQIPFSID
jgi:hypothetical protein